jgi:hypothetical protein
MRIAGDERPLASLENCCILAFDGELITRGSVARSR